MRYGMRVILTILLFFAGLGADCWAQAHQQPAKSRVLHFPKDRSGGKVVVRDAQIPRAEHPFIYWQDQVNWQAHSSQAKGDIQIPAGKLVSLHIFKKDVWTDLSFLKQLRKNDLYMLNVRGSSSGGPRPGDGCMEHISHLTGLKELGLNNTNISVKGIKHLSELKSLESLYIGGKINSSALAVISRLPCLKRLYIGKNRITNTGLKSLGRLKSLEELSIRGGMIGDDGLVHLAKLPKLQYLKLSGKRFTDEGMIHLKNIPNLKILDLNVLKQLTDKALMYISDCNSLENVNFYWNENITDKGLEYLKKTRSLKKLSIGHSKITDEGLKQLCEIKTLEYLHLPHYGLTDKGYACIDKLNNLKYLWVGGNSISPLTDKSLEYIAKLSFLEELLVGSEGFTDEGISCIAGLTSLKNISIFKAPGLTDKGLAKLGKLKSLESLRISKANITISGLSGLNVLTNLNYMTLYDVVQDGSGLDISSLENLEKLSISLKRKRKDKEIVSQKFRDDDMICIGKLKKLKWLQGIRGISDKGMAHLSGLTRMERFNVGGDGLTDKGLVHLRNMKKLNHLSLN